MANPFDPGFYYSDELRALGFASVGEGASVSRDCTIIGLDRIHLGPGVRVDSCACIFATGGMLRLEGWNHVGGHCHLSAAADLTIEAYAGLSQGVRIYTATDDYSGASLVGPCVPPEYRNPHIAPITIGRHSVVGSGTVILPGCNLAEGAAVGALSLVTKPLSAWTLYHGNPAKRIKRRSQNALALEQEIRGRLAA